MRIKKPRIIVIDPGGELWTGLIVRPFMMQRVWQVFLGQSQTKRLNIFGIRTTRTAGASEHYLRWTDN